MTRTSDIQVARDAIVQLLNQRAPTSSICPSEAARLLLPEDWRPLMRLVREAAGELNEAGVLRVTQKDEEVSVSAKGPIRLRRGPNFKA